MAEGQTISWQVHSHSGYEYSTDWFWGLGLGAATGAVVSIIFGNYLLAVILVVGAGSIAALVTRAPREHTARIDSRGLSIDGTLHPWSSLASFWVEEHEENPRLFVSTKGIIAPHLTVPLHEKMRAEQVRSLFKKYVREEEQGPHFGEQVAEFFGL